MDPNPSTHILQLPNDCMRNILKRLGGIRNYEAFALTCRHWLGIQSSCCKTWIIKCRHIICTCHSDLHRALTRYQHLQLLHLSSIRGPLDLLVPLLVGHGLQLQALQIDAGSGITDDGVSALAKGMPYLTYLRLRSLYISDVGLVALSESLSSLKHLDLLRSVGFSDTGIRAITNRCRGLRSVVLDCRDINGTGFQGCSKYLAYVWATTCRFEPEGIRAVLGGGGLEFLDISDSVPVPGHGFRDMDVGLVSRLTVLNLSKCGGVDDVAVMKLARGCRLLRKWYLAHCVDVTLVGWEAVAEECRDLFVLDMYGCRNLCDAGLQAVRDGCKRLILLYIGGDTRVSPTAREMFISLRRRVQVFNRQSFTTPCGWGYEYSDTYKFLPI